MSDLFGSHIVGFPTRRLIYSLHKYKISSCEQFSVTEQSGLCQTWLETQKTSFFHVSAQFLIVMMVKRSKVLKVCTQKLLHGDKCKITLFFFINWQTVKYLGFPDIFFFNNTDDRRTL